MVGAGFERDRAVLRAGTISSFSTITCFVCIEQPRKRKAERFLSGEQSRRDGEWEDGVAAGRGHLDERHAYRRGISAPRGETDRDHLGSVVVHGVIVRTDAGRFCGPDRG